MFFIIDKQQPKSGRTSFVEKFDQKMRFYLKLAFVLFAFIFGAVFLWFSLKDWDKFSQSRYLDQAQMVKFRTTTKFKTAVLPYVKPNLMCIVMSTPANLEERVVPVIKSWAFRCNYTIIVCNCKNLTLSSDESRVYLEKAAFLELDFVENYDRMAEKVMLIIRTVYLNYGQIFNWFLLTDDDTFIFTRNLFEFIKSKNPKQPVTYGYNFKVDFEPFEYQSGGAGILFTQESMRRMFKKISKKGCDYKEGYGDVAIGLCAKEAGVKLGYSLDSKGRERFHSLDSGSHFFSYFPEWLYNYSMNGLKAGDGCCSDESISFHYMAPIQMEALAFFNKFN